METKKNIGLFSAAFALAFIAFGCVMGYKNIGLAPVVIVGGAGVIGFVMWYYTYLWRPIDPRIILPIFALTVAGLQIHIVEEYLTGFGPAMSRVFNISWTEKGFVIIFALVGPTIYTLTMIGLFFRVPIAGFIAWFIFIGPGFAEFTHFIFPLIQPAVEPGNVDAVSKVINGTMVADMPNYYLATTGRYYFSGMWTAVLPMIPGGYAIYRLIAEARKLNRGQA